MHLAVKWLQVISMSEGMEAIAAVHNLHDAILKHLELSDCSENWKLDYRRPKGHWVAVANELRSNPV